MKRGFLNSAKAKEKLAATATVNQSTSKSHSSSSDTVFPARPSKKQNSEAQKLSHGVVSEAGFSEGYSSKPPEIVPKPSSKLDYESFQFVYTTVPAVTIGTKLEDFPGGWTECYVSGHVKRQIYSAPGFPKPPLSPTGGSKPYRISPAGTKGLGMFATRFIRAGDLIIDERPLLVVPATIWTSPESMSMRDTKKYESFTAEQQKQIQLHEWGQNIKGAFDRMPEENQKAFMDLFNSHKHDGSSEIAGRVRTNGIGAGNLKDKDTDDLVGLYSAICKDISRINHSCCPNTIYRWASDTFSVRIHAARDIPADTEITILYCNVLTSAADRAAALAPYGITSCACSPSCRDPALSRISDERRKRFREKTIALFPPLTGPKPGEAKDAWVAPAIERLRELEEEQLEASDEYRRTVHQLVNIYIHLQDVDKVLVYTPKLYATCKARLMDDHCPSALLTKEGIKKSPQWMMSEMQKTLVRNMPQGAGVPLLMSFV